MKKCKGLPLAIVTIGGFLAKQPKTPIEWKKLNSHISAEFEMNQGLGNIKNVLKKSYDGLPYHLKPCFLYLSIFPEDHIIKRDRLVRRWIAEGYSTEVPGKSLTEIADSHFMELIDRSMILPNKRTYFSRKKIDSCQVHDLMREISISKAAEENLIFRLEEGCSSNRNGRVRHLSISANWKGDQGDFENTVDVSRIRSLTVFGKWRPFFISDKMTFLRVLDLQDTKDLCNHHLEHIEKFLHLRYLSLKGCRGIYRLPDSVGNMRHLQTLDLRFTRITMLPNTIIKLKQLQYLCIGGLRNDHAYFLGRFPSKCAALCIPRATWMELDMEASHGRCAKFWNLARPFYAISSISVPRGAGNMKALHTLGTVDIGRSGNSLKEIEKITGLRKLEVVGINKKNCHGFFSTLKVLSRLESLTVFPHCGDDLCGLLDDVPSPPNNLRSLTLRGNLVKLPAWITTIQNLVKLCLEYTKLLDSDGIMQMLGNLPHLAILGLWIYTFDVEGLRLHFLPEAFPSLVALYLSSKQGCTNGDEIASRKNVKSVEFSKGAVPKLEMLEFSDYSDEIINVGLFSGLTSLPNLKKFQLIGSSEGNEALVEDLRAQLSQNPNRPVLMMKW
ncbi:hypothetical protein HU200_003182 [Digitaria exilis]|uniref:NB-ARC domain-containing protein n=1 Tax=Digitaria exilis TaxID=1010633 RepID=A0A835FVC9_9POAL|nr:hypothetical protein HU200_003182 [Digitaria exilis]